MQRWLLRKEKPMVSNAQHHFPSFTSLSSTCEIENPLILSFLSDPSPAKIKSQVPETRSIFLQKRKTKP